MLNILWSAEHNEQLIYYARKGELDFSVAYIPLKDTESSQRNFGIIQFRILLSEHLIKQGRNTETKSTDSNDTWKYD